MCGADLRFFPLPDEHFVREKGFAQKLPARKDEKGFPLTRFSFVLSSFRAFVIGLYCGAVPAFVQSPRKGNITFAVRPKPVDVPIEGTAGTPSSVVPPLWGERLVVGAMLPVLHRSLQLPSSNGRTIWPKCPRTSSSTG
jgi:hypothetical protein